MGMAVYLRIEEDMTRDLPLQNFQNAIIIHNGIVVHFFDKTSNINFFDLASLKEESFQ
jgi:hypothetical protein